MEVTINKLVYGGDGLAHHDGHTVFVPYVLPDEVVAVRPTERKKKFVRGQPLRIVQPSPARVAPPCPHFAACGGCHYQHIGYDDQLRFKSDILRETLRRIGRIDWTGPIARHPSQPLGYRNRAQWKVRVADGNNAIGYFRAGTTALEPVDQCPILSPLLAAALESLRALLSEAKLPAALREVEAFADAGDTKLLLSLSAVEFDAPAAQVADTLRAALPGVESILVHESSRDRFELAGPGYLVSEVAGHRYRIGHLSFFQVNRFLIEEMLRAVTAGSGGRLALDLYAGVGLFSLPLTETFERVVAVESNAAAARDLAANLAGRPAEIVARDAAEFLASCTETPDLVVLDPPRAGVEPPALNRLAALAPARIVYLSCDPATLARDLQSLTATGYAIEELHLFDVFPQTFHIETLVRLARRG